MSRRRRQRPDPPRIALTRDEAAASLGMSIDSFDRYVRPHVRCVRENKLRLWPVRELEKWADDAAELELGMRA